MAQVSDLRGRGLLITRIGAKTDFTEVRVYWASSQSDSGKVGTNSIFLFLLGTFTYFRFNLLDATRETGQHKLQF
jgi:hypothetical protein